METKRQGMDSDYQINNNRSLKVKKKLKLNFSSEQKLREEDSGPVRIKGNGQVLIQMVPMMNESSRFEEDGDYIDDDGDYDDKGEFPTQTDGGTVTSNQTKKSEHKRNVSN